MAGRRSEPLVEARQSMTTRLEMPVASSASSRTEKFSTRSSNRTLPPTSVMIGVV